MNKFISTGLRSTVIAVAALTAVVMANNAAAQSVAAGAAKAAPCTGCHGVAGISEYIDWPSLRGQKAEYLVTQLTDYREGRRENPIMARVAQALSDEDIADLAAYFSSLTLTPPEDTRLRIHDVNGGVVTMLAGPSSADPVVAKLKSGSPVTELERSGDWVRVRTEPSVEGWIHASLLVEAPSPPEPTAAADTTHEEGAALYATCGICHGEDGISINEMWPNLRGQNSGYLAIQLRNYREGKRINALMAPFAQALSDEEINKISAYLASLEIFGASIATPTPRRAIVTPYSEVAAGVGYVDQDNRNFGKYSGLNQEGAYALLEGRLKLRDDAVGTWRELKVRNLGLDGRELQWNHLRQGDWGYSIAYNEIPRHEPLAVVTPVSGIGSPSLTRGAANVPVDLETKRERISVGLDKAVTSQWRLRADFRNEEKKGARLFAAGGVNFEFLPEPIDSTTHLLDVQALYSAKKFQLEAGVYGSQYRNEFDELTWRYIVADILNLPPDNQSYQLYAKGGYSFNPTTRATFKLAYQEARQTDRFSSPSLTGRSDLDGNVATTLFHAGISARPLPKLALTGNLRYENRDDKTPRDQYLPLPSPGSTYDGKNEPRDYEKAYGKLEASYTLPRNYRVIGALEYDKTERNTYPYRSVSHRDNTEDISTTLALWRSMSHTLTGGLSYTHLARSGSDFYQNILIPPTTLTPSNAVAPYHYADRDSDKIRLSVSWSSKDTSSLQFYLDIKRADIEGDRDGTGIGPQRHDERVFAVDAAHYFTPHWQATAWYNFNEYEWHNTVRNVAASAADTSEQTGQMFGLGMKGTPTSRVELGANFSYSYIKHRWTQDITPPSALAAQLPLAKLRQATLDLFFAYMLNERSALRFDYIYDRYSSNDPTWTDWGNGAGGAYADGTVVQEVSPQRINFIGIRYNYSLGSKQRR